MAYVLCVDDDRSVTRLLADIVEFCRHVPVVETQAVDAVSSHLRDPRIRAVLADYLMPRMSGIEVLEAFFYERPDVRRILVTAAPGEPDVRAATRSGLVQLIITKPPSISDIRLALAWL